MKEKPFPVWFWEVCGPECSPYCDCLWTDSSLPKPGFVFTRQCPQPLTEPQESQKKESAATFGVLLWMQHTGWGFEPMKSHGCHPRLWVFAGAHHGPFWSQLQDSFLAFKHRAYGDPKTERLSGASRFSSQLTEGKSAHHGIFLQRGTQLDRVLQKCA